MILQVINRVIALGERTKWGASEGGTANSAGSSGDATGAADPQKQRQQRWVQFGAVYNSRMLVEQPPADARATQPAAASQQQQAAGGGSSGPLGRGASSSSASGGRQLADYLALPIEEYSLLDPKWISREEGGLFRFSLPLQDLVNVDLQPEIFISVLAEPQQRRVTLAGTRAALGSPELDQAFKLNVTAVVSERQQRRIPMPDHLPGRPVYRLRRWAAAARGKTWPPESSGAGAGAAARGVPQPLPGPSFIGSGSGGGSSSSSSSALPASEQAAGAAAVAAAAAAAAGAAPFPTQHVYISHDEQDEDEFVGPAELAAAERVAELAVAELEVEEAPSSTVGSTPSSRGNVISSNGSGVHEASGPSAPVSPQQPQQQQQQQAGGSEQQRQGQGPQALLHCRAQVTMAVRVPGPLNVVPNALLGYAGSLILRAVLTATLPNFLELLAADYRRWAGLSSGAAEGRQLDAPVGDLFSDAAATVQEGRQRRQGQGPGAEAVHGATEVRQQAAEAPAQEARS